MWESVSAVGTGLGLAAFAIAAVVKLYQTRTRARLEEIKSAPDKDRLRAIKAIAEAFDINIADLPEKERAGVVMLQLRTRAARERRLFILFVIVALLCFSLATTALITSKNGRDLISQLLKNKDPGPQSSLSTALEPKFEHNGAQINAISTSTVGQVTAPVPSSVVSPRDNPAISDVPPRPRPSRAAVVEATGNSGDYWTDSDKESGVINPFAYASRCQSATLWFKEEGRWNIFSSKDQRFDKSQQLSMIWFGNYLPDDINIFIEPPYPESGPKQTLTRGLGEATEMQRWPDGSRLSCEAPLPVQRRINFKIPNTISPGIYTLGYCDGGETCTGFGPNFSIN